MWTNLLDALGLGEAATEEQALGAVSALKGDLATARNRAETPDLAKFVPRGDYDAQVARALNAEQQLADQARATLDAEIAAEVDGAVKAGKVTPATADFYRAMCRTEGGLAQFREFLKAAPVLGADTALNRRAPGADGGVDAAALEIGKLFGHSAEDLKTYGGR